MIRHLSQQFKPNDPETKNRNFRAFSTWLNIPFNNTDLLIEHFAVPSKGNDVSEPNKKDVPFFKQIINDGIIDMPDEDIVIFTNNDSCLIKEAYTNIRTNIENGYAILYSNRIDIIKPSKVQLTQEQALIKGQQVHEGADLFVFPVGFWKRIKDNFPNLLLGFEGWDWILKIKMGLLTDNFSKINPPIVYHESHGWGYWQRHRLDSQANLYNRNQIKQWIKNNITEFNGELEKLFEIWPESRNILTEGNKK